MNPEHETTLVRKVAEHDRGAFEELFALYEKAAYSVALRITGNSSLAQDAVQDAMLGVWNTAAYYRSEAPVRSWILQIVAMKSLSLLRLQARAAQKKKRMLNYEQKSVPGSEEKALKNEAMEAMRGMVSALPQLEQQILTMHFSTGMTQEEIAGAVAVPPSTVSYKMNKAMRLLRVRMGEAGFASAALAGPALGDALSSGASVPPGLREKVLAGLSETAKESVRQAASTLSRRASHHVAAAGQSAASKTVIAMLVAVSGAGIWWAVAAKPSQSPAPELKAAVPAQTALQAVTQQPPPALPSLPMWNFNAAGQQFL